MTCIGLALSGGGFRATLHHLGVIRYLRDSGGLEQICDIAAVSGGSVLAAHLVLNWDRYTGDDAAFAEAAAEILRFVQYDVRNRIVRRLPLAFPLRAAARLLGWRSPSVSPNGLLEGYYRRFLFGDRRLFELPEKPGLHILATNVGDGVMAVFNRDGLHIQTRGADGRPFQHVPGATATVAKAVAASSAFPGFFPPVEITAADLGLREGQFASESFTDGGVYDNLGTRAFAWLSRAGRTYDRVLVSDAGKPFQILGSEPLGFVAQSIRATDILWDRVWQLERENFGDRNGYFFAAITQIVDPHDDPHALHPVVQSEIASIRTDLDRFDDLEVAALVRHGYEVARATHKRIADRALRPVKDGPAWDPLPGRHALPSTPPADPAAAHGTARTAATSETARLATRLRRSSRRRILSSLLDPRDWPTWIYVALAALLLVWLPIRFYRMHRHAVLLAGVIDSIAKGDPEIRLVLDLVDGDRSASWSPVPTTDSTVSEATTDFSGVDILAFTRIVDLRRAVGRSSDPLKIRDRLLLRFNAAAGPGRQLVFRSLLPAAGTEFRQPPTQPPVSVARVSAGGEPPHLEIHCDLPGLPPGQTQAIEMTSSFSSDLLTRSRLSFEVRYPADLVTIWVLFPEDHPYRAFDLLRYPAGRPEEAEPMSPRYTIDHPFGTLIGWSVLKPDVGNIYECRWKVD